MVEFSYVSGRNRFLEHKLWWIGHCDGNKNNTIRHSDCEHVYKNFKSVQMMLVPALSTIHFCARHEIDYERRWVRTWAKCPVHSVLYFVNKLVKQNCSGEENKSSKIPSKRIQQISLWTALFLCCSKHNIEPTTEN